MPKIEARPVGHRSRHGRGTKHVHISNSRGGTKVSSGVRGAYHQPMRNPAKTSQVEPGIARIRELLATAETWSGELGIPPLSTDAADRATALFLSLDPTFRDAEIRVFPSERAGIAFQRRTADVTRVLEVDPDGLHGSVHERKTRVHHHYALTNDTAAIAFLGA